MKALALPWEFIYHYTCPNCETKGWEHWYPITFIISLCYVAVFTEFILKAAETLAKDLGMRHAFAGAVFLALGAQVSWVVGFFPKGERERAWDAI